MAATVGEVHRHGMLLARPNAPTRNALRPGLHGLAGPAEDHLLLVPADSPDAPVPLVVFLHGSGAEPSRSLRFLEAEAERLEFLLLVPKAFHYTWDVILGGFGEDVESLDLVLTEVFARFPVDPDRILLAGFSDGASYALTLGLRNGELFRRIVAYSPGFVVPGPRMGRPRIFVSHGVDDEVLPIDRCSRALVPRLRSDGYEVDFREFAGGHAVPSEVVAASLAPLGESRVRIE